MTPRWLRTAGDYPRGQGHHGRPRLVVRPLTVAVRALPRHRIVSDLDVPASLAWSSRTTAHRRWHR